MIQNVNKQKNTENRQIYSNTSLIKDLFFTAQLSLCMASVMPKCKKEDNDITERNLMTITA